MIDIHADDFGISPLVTSSIWKLVESEVVTGVSVIVNGFASDRALTLINGKASLRVGLHLNVSESYSLSEPSRVELLLDSNGAMNLTPSTFYRRFYLSSPKKKTHLLAQITEEFSLQIEKYCDSVSGRPLVLDSHLHLHLLPELNSVVHALLTKYKVSNFRTINEPHYRRCTSLQDIPGQVKRLFLNWCSRRIIQSEGNFDISKSFGVLDSLHFNKANAKRMATYLKQMDDDTFYEIICHPGQSDISEKYWTSRPDFEKVYQSSARHEEALAVMALSDILRNPTN